MSRHDLNVLAQSKVRSKTVGRTGAFGNSRRAPSEVMSRTKQFHMNDLLFGITTAGAKMRVRVTNRRSVI